LDLDGCATPVFRVHSSNRNEVAGIVVSVQQYAATA
jgi:hypothetical protein